ncbi:angiogenic factor with G patch and FHA domains 1 isoform X2 [Drosophila novamexicana]|uniref:angiogenic factor with G patch and FHA domains 1 isoform X2 n=1 Tax=Drosophila novamexicana TaxID=47314 RepID=UPI0011E5C43F|nr:angiogenic factor with G patch and FHA domains 1 isoform X2 [Drosophila novamexicana]
MSATAPDAAQAAAEEASAHDYIELKSMEDVEALEQKQLYAYIEKLHGIIRKYDTKIASYKQKLKQFLNKESISCGEKSTQAANGHSDANGEEAQAGKELSPTDAFSFVDEMRQAAKHAENLNNFVYEPTSGMYYDPKTGYYYNAEYGLYYDGNTGCYYSYDQAKDSYEFHSQAQVQCVAPGERLDYSSLLARFRKLSIDRMRSNALDIAKKYPPSLRIIVQETNVPELTVGSLHLITYKGGTLGREGAHDVIIPDVNVSKCHLNFHYDTKQAIYKCRDLGSRNGTVLNGVRMSESKAASETLDLMHGSVLGIGQTKLLCHVHEGNSTCGLCEPGLLIETPAPAAATATASGNVLTHKEQLKKLQKKYGLENEKFVEASVNPNPNYNDRSAQRRIKVGSSTDKEKTEVACVHTEIASSNKGFKMLSQLGWQKGETLGKSNQGLLTPINVVANEGTTGLGSSEPLAKSAPRSMDKRKLANLKITQARYQRANDIFVESDESD